MPLSAPAERELLHLRDITLRGYRRTDGLFDVEATLSDTKTYAFGNRDRGTIHPGEKLHGMAMRMTVNEDMVITAFEAVSDYTPYSICPAAAAHYSRLAGLRIAPGFMKQVHARVGGVEGCTHLRELIQQMATVAFQTLAPLRRKRQVEAGPRKPPALLNTCYAYASNSEVVRDNWPDFYTGKRDAAE